jgi:hypothetical protein
MMRMACPLRSAGITRFVAVGSEVARLRAGHRPPLKLYVQFCAYSFHEDSRFRDAIEGINRIRFTSPYSPYSLVPATVSSRRCANV